MIATHIEKFYPALSGEPPVYVVFSDDDLPEGATVAVTPSDSGDLCHREIDGVGNNALKKSLMALPPERYMICDEAGDREMISADYERLSEAA